MKKTEDSSNHLSSFLWVSSPDEIDPKPFGNDPSGVPGDKFTRLSV